MAMADFDAQDKDRSVAISVIGGIFVFDF